MTATSIVQKAYCGLAYRLGFAEWDIRDPQPELVRLEEGGWIRGRNILDIGCGAGGNAIFLALKGYVVTGIDLSEGGLRVARKRAGAAGAKVEFHAGNALRLATDVGKHLHLKAPFDCAIDFGLFHQFRRGEIEAYVDNIASVVKPGGQLIVLCFSEEAPAEPFGPRRISRGDLASAFADRWEIEEIRPADYHSTRGEVPSWLALLQLATPRC